VGHRTATPEDLPALELTELRTLDLEEPSGPGRAAHVSAASGVVRRAEFVYVVGDDELFLAEFDAAGSAPGRLRRALSGDLPGDYAERKRGKPDLEVLTILPPYEDHPHGALLGLGSGSEPTRDRGFAWALAADGSLAGDPRELELTPLYSLLRERLPELNVEGAAVMGDRLWLLQRGNGPRGENAVIELGLAEVMSSLVRERRLGAAEPRDVTVYDLGELGGGKLTFSDASPLGEDLLVFTASAEASESTYEDGAIRGSVVGTIDCDGEVRHLRTIDRRYKVEGVHAVLDTGVMTLTFVCDQDDPDVASPLLSATLPVDPSGELPAAPGQIRGRR
jgi:hypothetical protein